ncbi:FliM/FliN family flagellar motor C-terminal domain-containing protein [Bythopirellula goksoeyrii]|uniref:Flagellar motor switch protein FliN n=1 Tax=Bythopirellula goksoeyrii TaxID=1400387 RepID=A0A5B9QLJ2_9BACT|nr:FliM/FliN family flagellar motor C-terminal domain-containing protein [Bythopirellula goksoeyrii]QEG37866.1 Flagellar motor switch protein FliN [Bythopirellula goksoeyrii]
MSDPNSKPADEAAPEATGASSPAAPSFADLPSYTRSLLKISVPVRVILASKKENLMDVVEMAPGTIIKFEKPCDEVLQLFVGNQQVAEGEAVKVGDKFGFRTTTMILPREHFSQVRKKKTG